MRLTIDHQTRYHYSEPVRRVIQLLRVTPQSFTDFDWLVVLN